MKAIIEVDVPEFQIGQEVSIYFKDTMYIHSICKKADDWIPVSERLPEDRHAVLVTAYWHETYQVMIASYYGDGLWWCVPFNNCGEHMQRLEPKAWMPLPGPYKGNSKSYGKKNLLPYSEDVYERVERNPDPESWVHFKPESGEGVNDEQV